MVNQGAVSSIDTFSLSEVPARDPVSKAVRVLVYLVDSDVKSWTARALAAELNAPVSTVHRILTSLSRSGVLVQDGETAAYEFSTEFHRIARRVIARFPLAELARDQLLEISRVTGETALLGMLDSQANRMSFIAQAEGSHPLRYVVPLNTWVALTRGASGLAILAYLDDDRRAQAIDEYEPGAGDLDRAQIEQEIARIRSNGYAISHGRRINGATGIAAPIFDAHSRVVGDVMVTMPSVRFSAEDEPGLIELVSDQARTLTRLIGGIGPELKGIV